MNDSIETDTWLQYLPGLHRELAAPGLANGLPASFVGLDFEHSCAWWETLRYLMRSLLGWRCLPEGLAWWYEAGKPSLNDPLLRLVKERWDTRGELDWFACREWEYLGHTGHDGDDPAWPVRDGTSAWLRDLQSRPPLMEYSPYGAGYNPLHLGHSDSLRSHPPAGPSTGSHDVAARQATLIVHAFDSWQHELHHYGASLPSLPERSWKVEVFDRKVGFLGLFRQSRVTGRWFQGKHHIHMAGNVVI